MTKTFQNISEAVQYKNYCPICKEELIFSCKDIILKCTENFGKLCFELVGEDLLFIDPRNSKIETVIKQSKNILGYYPYNGLSYHKLGIECNCCMYGYMLQIQVDMTNKKLHSVLLNSERISIEDENNKLYEIINTYTTEKTEYHYYDNNDVVKSQVMPIINLNFDNPNEIITKVKKILIFS